MPLLPLAAATLLPPLAGKPPNLRIASEGEELAPPSNVAAESGRRCGAAAAAAAAEAEAEAAVVLLTLGPFRCCMTNS
jgi:hypothetical protein